MNRKKLLLWLSLRLDAFPTNRNAAISCLELPEPWYWEYYQSPNGCQWEIHSANIPGVTGTEVITPIEFRKYRYSKDKS